MPRILFKALFTSSAAGPSPFLYSNSTVTIDMPAMFVELTCRVSDRVETSSSIGLDTVAAATSGVAPGTWLMMIIVGRSLSGKRFLRITTRPYTPRMKNAAIRL